MTTDNNPNPSSAPSTFPPKSTQVPTHPANVPPADTDAANETANRMAHNANKTHHDYEREHAKPFSK